MTADMYYTLGIGSCWAICGFLSTLFLGLITVGFEDGREVCIEGYPLFMAFLLGIIFGPYAIPACLILFISMLLCMLIMMGIEKAYYWTALPDFLSKLNPFPICFPKKREQPCNCGSR